jgi:DNA mismatch endonuclease (patch repair protein)
MADVVDKATRSRMMSGIRGKDTIPEVLIRKALHSMGFRFRLNARDLPGCPDILLPRHRTAIFVNGCFWHAHRCRYFKKPGVNAGFWVDKLKANVSRDRRHVAELRRSGWRVIVVWECAVRSWTKAGDDSLPLALRSCMKDPSSAHFEFGEAAARGISIRRSTSRAL